MNDFQIRWMIRRDMAEVLGIENDVFSYPWPEEEFIRVLRARNCIGMITEQADKVIGYMIYELHKSSIYLLNFAVQRDHQRQGVGIGMIGKLVSKLNPQRRRNVSLCVSEDNLPAQLFFRDCGFKATGIEKGFFVPDNSPAKDAYRMVLTAKAFAAQRRRAAESTLT